MAVEPGTREPGFRAGAAYRVTRTFVAMRDPHTRGEVVVPDGDVHAPGRLTARNRSSAPETALLAAGL